MTELEVPFAVSASGTRVYPADVPLEGYAGSCPFCGNTVKARAVSSRAIQTHFFHLAHTACKVPEGKKNSLMTEAHRKAQDSFGRTERRFRADETGELHRSDGHYEELTLSLEVQASWISYAEAVSRNEAYTQYTMQELGNSSYSFSNGWLVWWVDTSAFYTVWDAAGSFERVLVASGLTTDVIKVFIAEDTYVSCPATDWVPALKDPGHSFWKIYHRCRNSYLEEFADRKLPNYWREEYNDRQRWLAEDPCAYVDALERQYSSAHKQYHEGSGYRPSLYSYAQLIGCSVEDFKCSIKRCSVAQEVARSQRLKKQEEARENIRKERAQEERAKEEHLVMHLFSGDPHVCAEGLKCQVLATLYGDGRWEPLKGYNDPVAIIDGTPYCKHGLLRPRSKIGTTDSYSFWGCREWPGPGSCRLWGLEREVPLPEHPHAILKELLS